MTTPLCDLPEDMSLLRETARRFMRHEVRPEEDKLPHDATELPADVLKRLQAKARALGMWQVESPVEWGGAGLSLLGQAVVAEQASQCKMGAYIPACHAFGWDPPIAIFEGRKDQIEKYAVPTLVLVRKLSSQSRNPAAAQIPAAPFRCAPSAKATATFSMARSCGFPGSGNRLGALCSRALVRAGAAPASPHSSSRRSLRASATSRYRSSVPTLPMS